MFDCAVHWQKCNDFQVSCRCSIRLLDRTFNARTKSCGSANIFDESSGRDRSLRGTRNNASRWPLVGWESWPYEKGPLVDLWQNYPGYSTLTFDAVCSSR